jgi:glucosamine--fructose-6-phosphate aminotransferase (isomerizing)
MCGIVGAIRAQDNVVDFLTDGLKRLEYRGYDSSGIAVQTDEGLKRVRRVGRVALMEAAAKEHPHISGDLISVVHNGIIENFEAERARLQQNGYHFESQTDTEVIAHAVHQHYVQNGGDLFKAVQAATQQFHGAYAIAVIANDRPQNMVVARMGCPLLIGLGEHETFIASDVSAVVAFTRQIMYLEDGDIAQLTADGVAQMIDKQGL